MYLGSINSRISTLGKFYICDPVLNVRRTSEGYNYLISLLIISYIGVCSISLVLDYGDFRELWAISAWFSTIPVLNFSLAVGSSSIILVSNACGFIIRYTVHKSESQA